MDNPTMASPRKSRERDHVDSFLEDASPDLPAGLDLTVEGIVERIHGIDSRIQRMQNETFEQLGLTLSDWRVINALRWSGTPYRRKVGWLARRVELTSGAMTSLLDGLEADGLVFRLRDPDDRRSVLVELTEKGRMVHDEGMAIQALKEALLAEALTGREKEQLNSLLRRVMLTLEKRYPGKHD